MDGLLLTILPACLAITGAAPAWLTTDRLIVLGIPLATFAAILVLDVRDKRAAHRVKAAALATQPKPQWAISLLVDADEESGIVRPLVQAFGPPLPSDITVYLAVGDEDSVAQMTSERHFIDPQTTTDLVLGTLTLPDGVSMEKAAGWDWAVIVVHERREIARRRGPVSVSGLVNDEGELQAPDLEPVPEAPEPPTVIPDPVRSFRWTIGLSGAVGGIAIGAFLLTTLTPWLWFAAVPLVLPAAILLVPAALLLHTTCPLCGLRTTVVGRTGAQRCDTCNGTFTLTPGPL